MLRKIWMYEEQTSEISEQSRNAYNNVYQPKWEEVKRLANEGHLNEIPIQKWSNMLDFDPATNCFVDLRKIVKTYTLTATWFIRGEIKEKADSIQKDLRTNLSFLEDTVFWQPLDSIHYAAFVVDRYEAKKNPSAEQISHRLTVTDRVLSSIAKDLPAPTMSAVGVSMMPDGTIFLEGVVDQDSLKILQDTGKERINALNDSAIDRIGDQNSIFHMTIGRLAKKIETNQFKELVDYIDENYYHRFLAKAKIDYLTLVEETGSFNATHNDYSQIYFKTPIKPAWIGYCIAKA